jgi:hypothetical protein
VIEQLGMAADEALLDENVRLEVKITRLRYRQLEVQAELNSRNVTGVLGYRGLTQLLQAQLRYTQLEARKRTLSVERFGARRGLTGEALNPVYPAVAEALAAGEICLESCGRDRQRGGSHSARRAG